VACTDAASVGPRVAEGRTTVWTHHVVDLPAGFSVATLEGGTGAVVRRCGFGCNAVVHDARISPGAAVDLDLPAGRYLVQIGDAADQLGDGEAAELTFGPG
jgi:hypothetical protein